MSEKKDIMSMKYYEFENEILAMGEKKFRASQIYSWIHEKYPENFDEITVLSKDLREKLNEKYEIIHPKTIKKYVSKIDGTVKFVYGFSDGNMVETVAMNYHHGMSICISTQVGCKMGCRFCASAIAGFVRNLKASEILSQVYQTEKNLGIKADSLVLMGIGEPLDNFENVMNFLEILSSPKGRNMSLRHVALSTCGIVPKINELAEKKYGLTLSVSLHASNDAERGSLMPINKKYKIDEVLDACRNYIKKTGRRVTFEYAVIENENSSKSDAKALAELLKGINCHVNLIPVNKVKERNYYSRHTGIEAFKKNLESYGVNVTIRRTLGSDIEAACGQLRRDNMKEGEGKS